MQLQPLLRKVTSEKFKAFAKRNEEMQGGKMEQDGVLGLKIESSKDSILEGICERLLR